MGSMGFQSTLPRRERHLVAQFCIHHNFYFNPRSREGSDCQGQRRPSAGNHFNPRSREGSDSIYKYPCTTTAISIHAPAKGATLRDIPTIKLMEISIHAPAKGATVPHRAQQTFYKFQSTLPRRERQQYYTTNFIFFV